MTLPSLQFDMAHICRNWRRDADGQLVAQLFDGTIGHFCVPGSVGEKDDLEQRKGAVVFLCPERAKVKVAVANEVLIFAEDRRLDSFATTVHVLDATFASVRVGPDPESQRAFCLCSADSESDYASVGKRGEDHPIGEVWRIHGLIRIRQAFRKWLYSAEKESGTHALCKTRRPTLSRDGGATYQGRPAKDV